ncbi:MAG: long-chain acyl-CoA synthetase, partial [Candidatus Azotimanducaceae bacterium]
MYSELHTVWKEFTRPGQPFEITTKEVRGQQLKAYAAAPANMRDLWLSTAPFAERDYLVFQDERWTYAD